MDKKASKTVSLFESWWDTIDTFEGDRSKYVQGLIGSDFKVRGIISEGSEAEDLTILKEAKTLGIDIVGLAREEIRKKGEQAA